MSQFLFGAIMMANLTIGLFFYRFGCKTKDRFFTIFAIAFWLLAIERIPLSFMSTESETRPFIYLIRLLAFIMIIAGILDKNKRSQGT